MLVNRFCWGSRAVAFLACSMLVVPPSTGIRAQETQQAVSEAVAEAPDAVGDEAAPLTVADELDAEPAFSMEELEQLVGPIALYPDPLLVQVLLASTFPLDVVRAHHFLQDNPDVTPEELVERAEQNAWDPSVISLVAFPTLLERMATDLDWTLNLGDAMTLQSDDLLDAVQNLRELAQANGALQTNDYQIVSYDEEDAISIAPAEPEVIYVPQYVPQQVYVTQPATTTVLKETGYSEGTLLATGLIAFTTGIILGSHFGRNRDRYDYYWGHSHRHVHWRSHRVNPPYYRPGAGYRPPHYRPRPPGYRPGGDWRPRPEHYRDSRARVNSRRTVTRDVNRNININDRQRPSAGNRASTLDRQLKDRGRDRPGAARPGTPQRPATRAKIRPGIADRKAPITRPGGRGTTAFGDRVRQPEVRRNRDRGAGSVNRAKRPAAAPSQRQTRPKANQRRPNANQRRPKAGANVFENRGGGKASNFGNRGRSSAGKRQRRR